MPTLAETGSSPACFVKGVTFYAVFILENNGKLLNGAFRF